MVNEKFLVRALIPYVFCIDAGATADWCVQVLGFVERDRWHNEDGVVTNVELTVGHNEVWLDGPVPDWNERLHGLSCWVGLVVHDVDAVYHHLRGRVDDLPAPRDRPFGARELTVSDPEGHQWGFITRTA